MEPPIIVAEGLSKRYTISHLKPSDTLRDSIAEAANRFIRRSPKTVRGNEEFWALKDVNFSVNTGEKVGIIGRNGAGKSTLLKILSQITMPTTGTVRLRGRVASLLEVGTGFHPELTGRENIFLNGAILGMKQREIKKKFNTIVEFSEIEQFIDTPVKRYSSGMYVRLAFAVAAHLEPEILIVDEVLAVGDAQFQKKCFGKMEDIGREGRTVLFVSHNMAAIHRLCTRTILLSHGGVSQDGPTEEVIRTYMSQGATYHPETTLPHDPAKPIHLRSVRLMNSQGDVTTEFRYDETIRLQIGYEVNRTINDCKIWYGVRTIEDGHVYSSADADEDLALRERRLPGYYETVTDIPARWLNNGRYYLVVGVVQTATVTSFDREEVSAITILDVGVPETGRPGVLQPYFPWETRRVAAPE